MNPKQSFQETPQAKEWENIVESKAFRAATEAALLQFQLSQIPIADVQDASTSFFRICGARDFVEVLSKIHLKPEPLIAKPDRTNLRHNV